jgi:hypothetical protein
VVLTASPSANSTFAGWSGGVCSGTGDKAYIASPGEKATIIVMSGPEGWLLQAAAANGAAQNAGRSLGEGMDTEDE